VSMVRQDFIVDSIALSSFKVLACGELIPTSTI